MPQRLADFNRDVIRHGALFNGASDVGAGPLDLVAILKPQAGQTVHQVFEGRQPGQYRLETPRRHAKAARHTNPFDPRELTELSPLATHGRDALTIDVLEMQCVAIHARSSAVVHTAGPARQRSRRLTASPRR